MTMAATEKREYKGIEIGRLVFACLIPFFHIALYPNGLYLDIIRQYFARVGVAFFFAVSVMFLCRAIDKYGKRTAMRRYLIRVGRVFCIWLLLYIPLILSESNPSVRTLIRELIFRTPAYLWFLLGCCFAAIPFCLMKNQKIMYFAAIVLYAFGTFYGGSYRWLSGGCQTYERHFLTTRNGLFFGFPLMCIGKLTWDIKKKNIPLLIVSGVALTAEIYIVGKHVATGDDRSMYFMLPFFVLELILLLREWNPSVNVGCFGKISSAIYVMQYGIIFLGRKILTSNNLIETYAIWLILLAVYVIPTGIVLLFRNKNIVKVLF